MKLWHILAAVSALAVGATVALATAHAPPAVAPVARHHSPAITVVAARRAMLPEAIDADGAVAAWQDVQVAARAVGMPLVEVRAQVGDLVQRGQLLARFDDRLAAAELAQAQATLVQAVASHRQTLQNRERASQLHAAGALSEQDLLLAVTQDKNAEAQEEAARAASAIARIRLDDTRVVAPDSGVVALRGAALGQIPPAGFELFRLIRQGRLEWRAELNAEQLARVRPGMAVSLQLPDGQTAQATIRQQAQALDPATRLGTAYADIAPGSTAKAAMYASGHIELASHPALTLPAACVVIRDGRTTVFRVEGGLVKELAVVTGRRAGGQLEIAKGLAAGDVVALEGAGFLNDGDAVRLANRRPAAPAGGG